MTFTLRPYQADGAEWLRTTERALLADEYGMGKTPQAIAALEYPALVVTSAYLVRQWYQALCEQLPTASISQPEGTRQRKQHELVQPADVQVLSYDSVRVLDLPAFETVTLDEAHRIRNHRAIQSEKAVELCWRTPKVHMLTATPDYKTDQDIYNLLRALDPHTHTSYWDWLRKWFVVNWGAPYTPKIYGVRKSLQEEYDAYLAKYMLRRTYTDVGRQLPPLVEKVFTFDLPARIQQEYDLVKKQWTLLGEPLEDVGTWLLTLRRLTMCHEKVSILLSVLDSIPTEPVLIYVWYKEHAYELAKTVEQKLGEHTLTLTGDTPPEARARTLEYHKLHSTPRIIIATIESLQEGANLQHIRHVVYAEETYVRGKHNQTLARVQRDRNDNGDTRPVLSYYMRARKTIDERIPAVRSSSVSYSDREMLRREAYTS